MILFEQLATTGSMLHGLLHIRCPRLKRGAMDACVSIIMPVYNCEQYLEQSFRSALSQSLNRLQVICIDDGSTDRTSEILASIAATDERVVIIRQTNQGAGKARNAGLQVALGEIVSFHDSDDYYPDSTALEMLYNAAKQNDVQVSAGFQVKLVGENHRTRR